MHVPRDHVDDLQPAGMAPVAGRKADWGAELKERLRERSRAGSRFSSLRENGTVLPTRNTVSGARPPSSHPY